MEGFRSMAKRNWEKNAPGMVREMKKQGIYEEQLDQAARRASEELGRRVNQGEQYEAAREDVERTHILEDPETTE